MKTRSNIDLRYDQKLSQINDKRVKLVALTFLIAVVLSGVAYTTSFSNHDKKDTSINVYLGDKSDGNVNLALTTFIKYYKNINILSMDSDPLENSGIVVIFAHGDEKGIILNQEFVSWESFSSMVSSSSVGHLYIMACFSNNIFTYLSQDSISKVTGLKGEVDAVVAGVIPIFFETSSSGIFLQITNLVSERVTDIVNGKVTPKLLANSESGYNFAIKKQYRSKKSWGVTYYKENILWFNIDEIAAEVYEIGEHAGLELILSYIEGAVSLTVLGVILVIVLVQAILIELTAYNRIRHDYMFGVSGILIPVPSTAFWYDYGDDNYRSNGKHSIPVPNPSGVLLYQAFSSISSSWKGISLPAIPPYQPPNPPCC